MHELRLMHWRLLHSLCQSNSHSSTSDESIDEPDAIINNMLIDDALCPQLSYRDVETSSTCSTGSCINSDHSLH